MWCVLLGQAFPDGLAKSQLKCQRFTAACSSFYLCFSSAIAEFCYLIFTGAKTPFITRGHTGNRMEIFLIWYLWRRRNSTIWNRAREGVFTASPVISSHHCVYLCFFLPTAMPSTWGDARALSQMERSQSNRLLAHGGKPKASKDMTIPQCFCGFQ